MCTERKSFTVDVAYCYEDASVIEETVTVFGKSVESVMTVIDSDRFYVDLHIHAESLKTIPVDDIIVGEVKEVEEWV